MSAQNPHTTSKQIPTTRGDVLILRTAQSFTVYAVGPVEYDGQQDFHDQMNVKYVTAREAAVAEAKTLVAPERKIFLRDLDQRTSFEISH